jgi:hypothetical protein
MPSGIFGRILYLRRRRGLNLCVIHAGQTRRIFGCGFFIVQGLSRCSVPVFRVPHGPAVVLTAHDARHEPSDGYAERCLPCPNRLTGTSHSSQIVAPRPGRNVKRMLNLSDSKK